MTNPGNIGVILTLMIIEVICRLLFSYFLFRLFKSVEEGMITDSYWFTLFASFFLIAQNILARNAFTDIAILQARIRSTLVYLMF